MNLRRFCRVAAAAGETRGNRESGSRRGFFALRGARWPVQLADLLCYPGLTGSLVCCSDALFLIANKIMGSSVRFFGWIQKRTGNFPGPFDRLFVWNPISRLSSSRLPMRRIPAALWPSLRALRGIPCDPNAQAIRPVPRGGWQPSFRLLPSEYSCLCAPG